MTIAILVSAVLLAIAFRAVYFVDRPTGKYVAAGPNSVLLQRTDIPLDAVIRLQEACDATACGPAPDSCDLGHVCGDHDFTEHDADCTCAICNAAFGGAR